MIDDLKGVIVTDLTTELMVTEGDKFNLPLLVSKVNNAVLEIMAARQYPKSYSEARIEGDLKYYHSNIRNLALYDYNQAGAEGQKSVSMDGTSISYVDREKFFYGVNPISRTNSVMF